MLTKVLLKNNLLKIVCIAVLGLMISACEDVEEDANSYYSGIDSISDQWLEAVQLSKVVRQTLMSEDSWAFVSAIRFTGVELHPDVAGKLNFVETTLDDRVFPKDQLSSVRFVISAGILSPFNQFPGAVYDAVPVGAKLLIYSYEALGTDNKWYDGSVTMVLPPCEELDNAAFC